MNKIAFIYPGQGVQTAGMGKDFYHNSKNAKEVYDVADSILDFDIKKICFEENTDIHNTEYTQAALVTTYLAITEEIKKTGIEPDVTAGLSLGEYAAIAAAGGMSYEDAIKTVRWRGIFMNRAVPEGEGAMAAVLGMSGDEAAGIIKDISGVSVANYNCPGQIVITGKKESVSEAAEKLENAGAKKVVSLNVSGPFHSEFLKGAGEKLGEVLENVSVRELKIPYVTNVTADYVRNRSEIKGLLVKQVYSSVRWEESIRNMLADGVNLFVEIGPGRTLTGFLRKIDRNAKCINVGKYEDLEKLRRVVC